MKREELFKLRPLPRFKPKEEIEDPREFSTFSCMEPDPFQSAFTRKKGESAMSRARVLKIESKK